MLIELPVAAAPCNAVSPSFTSLTFAPPCMSKPTVCSYSTRMYRKYFWHWFAHFPNHCFISITQCHTSCTTVCRIGTRFIGNLFIGNLENGTKCHPHLHVKVKVHFRIFVDWIKWQIRRSIYSKWDINVHPQHDASQFSFLRFASDSSFLFTVMIDTCIESTCSRWSTIRQCYKRGQNSKHNKKVHFHIWISNFELMIDWQERNLSEAQLLGKALIPSWADV